MSGSQFIPKMQSAQSAAPAPEEVAPAAQPTQDDTGTTLQKVAQYAVIGLFGLVPVFFMPGLWASLGFGKVLLALVAGIIVIFALSILALRRSDTKTVLPVSWMLFIVLVLIALASGLLSGDTQDALRGSVMETQTVGFLGVLALAMTIPLVLQGSKLMSIKALAFFAITTTLLLVYNVLRILFGPEFLAFGSFPTATASPIGGFNDLAIFAGLTIILSLITMLQLPLRTILQGFISALVAFSLFILAVVNFFNVWIIIGFFSLLVLIYLLTRDTLFGSGEAAARPKNSRMLIATTIVVCVVSAGFIVAGEYFAGKIGQMVNVSHVEVRPSFGATVGVLRGVYSEDALLGVGPNRFADAWRQHKDPSINQTIFWDTDFNAGSGFVPTVFVNLGLLGGILLVAFHLFFLYLGYRMLLRTTQQDHYWYYFGVVSFAAAVFIWGLSYVYVPGTGVLLLGALFTGFTFVAAGALLPNSVRTVPLVVNQRRGFFLMAAIILIITASIALLFVVGKQYSAQVQFAKAQVAAESIDDIDLAASSASILYNDDRFSSTRAQIQLAKLAELVNSAEPTEESQLQFTEIAAAGIEHANRAIEADPTNPDHYAILAGVYNNLALAGVSGASERADAALNEAKRLDPSNPGYFLIGAQMATQIGDLERARAEINQALGLKRNFTQALYLSAQLDISEGNTESAIATTRAITTLEPNNPTRYFQLGVLLTAAGEVVEAVRAYQTAIALDPQYANARYLLALTLLQEGEREIAVEQLRVVQQTNPENAQLQALIDQIESGEAVPTPDLGLEVPVSDVEPSEGFDDEVITDSDETDTDLVTPVNQSSEGDEETEAEEEATAEVEETEPAAATEEVAEEEVEEATVSE